MIRLAEEFFATKNDPSQIAVTEEVMGKLRQIHHATLSEQDDGNGPIAWVLVIPTTHDLMDRFIAGQINEQELLEKTLLGAVYDTVYVCSALVLPEHRGKGLAKRLTCSAIKSIQEDHRIKSLFYWAFSHEGTKLAVSVARALRIPLYKRPE
jgi:ribosomal protein S18 acetylase RimI-like enzyme